MEASIPSGLATHLVTDMAGRALVLPRHITRVHAAQPYTYVLMAALAPERLVGLPTALSREELVFVPALADKPVLGSGMGPGAREDLEAVRASGAQVALAKGNAHSINGALVDKYAALGIPVVFVDLDAMEAYPEAIGFVGTLLDCEARAAQLAAHARTALDEVAAVVADIPPAERVRVYYAESVDGLSTECEASVHVDAIRFAGGQLVHPGQPSSHFGMEQLSFEQLQAYDPSVIVATEPGFLAHVSQDERWQGLAAVKHGRILLVPRTPFNWIDRPPSIMRVMGLRWLLHRLYPARYPLDLRASVMDFQTLFFGLAPEASVLDACLN